MLGKMGNMASNPYIGLPARRCDQCAGVQFGLVDGAPVCSDCAGCECVMIATVDRQRQRLVFAPLDVSGDATGSATGSMGSAAMAERCDQLACLECGSDVVRGGVCVKCWPVK